jgi:TPR repeat protein
MINLASVVVVAFLFQSVASQDIAALKARAETGDTQAQVRLGVAYASGDGVMANDTEAVEWFRKAAEKGDAAGEYSLGEMYLSGRGVPANLAEGVKWIRRSAEAGDARGQFNFAAMYSQGQGVPKDDNEAAKWMRKAADQGLAAGQFGVGSMYAHGRGVPQSAAEAVKWYRKAADQGDPAAMNNLAFLLATSTDPMVRNPKEAVAVAQKAVEAETDNPAYLDTLATAYFESGQPDKAAETERRALIVKPEDSSYKKALDKYEAASRRTGALDMKDRNSHLQNPISAKAGPNSGEPGIERS